MYANKAIGIIIPTYKNDKLICKVIKAIPEFVDIIIVVNDASPDRTSEVVRRLDNNKVVLIEHKRNQGVGAAMKTGLTRALELNIDIAVKVDGDNQMDINYLPELIAPIIESKADYAKGNRFYHKKDLIYMPLIRLTGNLILSLMTKIVSGYWHISDSQNGYLAISAEKL